MRPTGRRPTSNWSTSATAGRPRRERWSLTFRFTFLEAIPSELVVYNPMGLLITYLQADRALATEAPA
ncbi:MAG: hypothetical protein OXT72_09535 [Gammaproteobacteria bacterium]|nr:hypothetical protein [Gammaproteobacteria bacterium]MDE0246444.1 hypothetical protein [Gammaproteobacteria bacterium]